MAFSIALLFLALVSSVFCNVSSDIPPEATMTVNEIIEYHGYQVKDHEVITKDGFILTLQRIQYGLSGSGDGEPRKPVLLMHGLFCSSAAWVTNAQDKNLPYILANAGYDVWLGNVRGTLYGRKHLSLEPDEKDFWAFSFDEMSQYDAPAIIDTMLNVTGFKSILYIGHSMGTTIGFSLLSKQPQYNEKIKGLLALSPIATVGHITSPIKILAPIIQHTDILSTVFGTGELMANNEIVKLLSTTVCTSPVRIICSSLLFIACGFNLAQMNQTLLPVILHHTPAATSVQNVLHYVQMISSNQFQYFDYGAEKNKEKYGQLEPLLYNMTKISAPVALFWSDNDYLADPQDVSRLAQNLPNLVLKHRVPLDKFSHLDFLWGISVKELLYEKVISTMHKMWKN